MPQGHLRFRLFPVRSPLLGESLIYFLFLRVLRCFSSPRSPRILMYALTAIQTAGLSHSETRGSKVTCTSSRIIAACHVLLRLWEPRHPPYALKIRYSPLSWYIIPLYNVPRNILAFVFLRLTVSLALLFARCRQFFTVCVLPVTNCHRSLNVIRHR